MTRIELVEKLEILNAKKEKIDLDTWAGYQLLKEIELIEKDIAEMDNGKDFDADYDRYDDDFEDYDDYDDYDDVPFAEMMENEDFAQDGDFHNMEYDAGMDCWGNW